MATAQIEIHGVEALTFRLQAMGDAAPKAILRAIRRTRTTIMTRMARIVSQAAGVPVRRVRRSIHGTRPNLSDPDVLFTLWGGREALIRYARGIQQQALPPSAFRARMPAGHVGFFERRPGEASLRARGGRAKSTRIRPGVWHTLPIDEAYGPPFTTFLAGGALQGLLREAGEVFQKNLEHEIAFREGQSAA